MMRIGFGYDVHKLVAHRPLIMGGIDIPNPKGLLGHSDADVLLHAIIDALLGAAALGDIGTHFPASDNKYKNISSIDLLARTSELLKKNNYEIGNIDSTIVCESPRLSPHIPAMTEKVASTLGLNACAVSIKAKTEEGLGFTGNGDGIAAYAIACIIKKDKP